jgi:hypothetical protein
MISLSEEFMQLHQIIYVDAHVTNFLNIISHGFLRDATALVSFPRMTLSVTMSEKHTSVDLCKEHCQSWTFDCHQQIGHLF